MKLSVFDLQNKKLIADVKGHKVRITGMDWLASKKYIATASADGTVRIRNERGDSVNMVMMRTGAPYTVAFTPQGDKIIVGMTNGKVKIYSTDKWKELDSMQSGTTILDLKIDPSGRYFLTSGDKGQLFLWDLKKKNSVKQLQGHSNNIYGVVFHPNGKYAFSVSYDLSVKMWDVATGDCVLTLKEFEKELYTVSLSDDAKTLVVTETEGQVHVFKL